VEDLKAGQKRSKWYKATVDALTERRMTAQVLQTGAEFVAKRRDVGIAFAQFCFHKHLNGLTQSSADDFRVVKPFGVYPFLYKVSPSTSRFLLSFVLCNWRWLDRGRCKNYPRNCSICDCENRAWHILFECPIFSDIRDRFFSKTGAIFEYPSLLINASLVAKNVADAGKEIFERLVSMTVT
jgi:hypothetical protein